MAILKKLAPHMESLNLWVETETNHIGQVTDINTMKIFSTSLFLIYSLSSLSACATKMNRIDVDKFIARRDICDHLRGEFPDSPDPEQINNLVSEIEKYCSGTDSELAELKIRYANNPKIKNQLNLFEPQIERKKKPISSKNN